MSADWATAPWLVIDTETTGVNVFADRIVEISAVTLNGYDVANAYTAIIDPGIEIPTGASDVHGITTDRAQAEGASPADVLADVADLIRAALDLDVPLVMYNARFDWPLLLVEADRHGVTDFPCAAPIVDPYLIDRLVDRYRKGKRQLGLVAAHYGVELGDAAHGALADATAAGRVMREIVRRYPEVGERSLASMLLWQVQGHEQDRERFVDYMRRNVDPQFDTPAGWPIPVAVAS